MRHPRRSSTSWWATTVLSCATSSGGWATALSPRRSSRRLSFAAWSAATTIRDSVVGWFYRVLRNAVIDHQRRQGVANRKLDAFAIELQSTKAGDEELTNVVCACVSQLAAPAMLPAANRDRSANDETPNRARATPNTRSLSASASVGHPRRTKHQFIRFARGRPTQLLRVRTIPRIGCAIPIRDGAKRAHVAERLAVAQLS